jgi:hypothetical protein
MNLEKVVLRIAGSSMLVGVVTGFLGVVERNHPLKVLAGCALGVGAFIGCVPLMLLVVAAIIGKTRR